MFIHFQSIVNMMRANKPQLPYNDHERALKLLHAVDGKGVGGICSGYHRVTKL